MKNKYDELLEACNGNHFEATGRFIAATRKLLERYHYAILESEAIQWVLTGEKPRTIDERREYAKQKYKKQMVSLFDELNYVDDRDVALAVRQSVEESISTHHLIYVHNDNLTPGQQARVRVLTRKIWHKFHEEVDL